MKKVESYDKFFSDEEKEHIIKDYVEYFLSIKELCVKYNIGSKIWLGKLLKGKTRNISEANRIAHKKYPDKFKLPDSAKEKIRAARLKFMKEHPEQTAWRLKNMSYPEKCFQKILEDNGLDKKYLIYREYSVFPYFIDFAFINEKLAVEIDGSQHLEEERKKRDNKKDKLLVSKGWRVLRIAANEVTHDGTNALNAVIEMLGDSNAESSNVGILKVPKTLEKTVDRKKYSKVDALKVPKAIVKNVGILKAPKTYEKAVRGEDGLTDKQRQNALTQRKTEWPNKEKLFEMVKSIPFTRIAEMYGVSDNAIKKWCKRYGLPYRKKDIDKLIGKEHKYASNKHICKKCGKEFISRRNGNIFCSDECYKKYIKEHGSKDFNNTDKHNWVHKENSDGSFTNKRVGQDEVELYISQGWIRGSILKR